MKRILLLTSAVALAATALLDLRAQTPPPTEPPKVTFPFGRECVVTLDRKTYGGEATTAPPKASGFMDDWTVRGQLIYLNEDWCVLKDGTFENWIPRGQVLLIRASR